MRKVFGVLMTAIVASPALALAQEHAAAASSGLGSTAFAAGLAIGIAALGGTLSQAKAISAGLEAIGRNPSASGKVFTPMILGLAFIESLVIFSFVIAYFLQGKV